jgi:hypothetical protein
MIHVMDADYARKYVYQIVSKSQIIQIGFMMIVFTAMPVSTIVQSKPFM